MMPQLNPIPIRAERTLAELENVIQAGLETFVAVGQALFEIRDRRLYREQGFKTFQEYCQKRWNMGRAYAYRLIDAAGVVANLSPIGDIPQNEAQARELSGLPADLQREVWIEALKNNPQPTAAEIRELVQSLNGTVGAQKGRVVDGPNRRCGPPWPFLLRLPACPPWPEAIRRKFFCGQIWLTPCYWDDGIIGVQIVDWAEADLQSLPRVSALELGNYRFLAESEIDAFLREPGLPFELREAVLSCQEHINANRAIIAEHMDGIAILRRYHPTRGDDEEDEERD